MPAALVATAGSASANTFITRVDATTYFGNQLNADAWTNASNDEKDQALLTATAILSRMEWAGSKATSTQALPFPRTYAPTLEHDAVPDVVAVDFVDESLLYYDDATIPAPIASATCELALVLLNAGSADPFASDVNRLKSKTVGPISKEWFDSQDQIRGLGRFPHVIQIVQHLLRTSQGVEVLRA